MDDPSEPTGASEPKDGDVVSLASRLSGIKVSSGPQSPAEVTEPEPEAVETSEGGVAAAEPPETAEPPEPAEPAEPANIPELPEPAESDEPADLAKLREGPAATEAEGEESRERAEPVEAEPEEPAEPGSAGGPREPEEEREEAPEDTEKEEEASEAARKEKAPLHVSLQLSPDGRGKVEPIPEEEAEYEEIESKSVEGSRAKSDVWQKGRKEQRGDEDSEWTEEVQRLQEEQLRSELLDQYRSLMVERSHYQRYNMYLQHKICQALRKKKGLDVAEVPDMGPEPEAPEKEHAYVSYLAVLEELRKQRADDLAWYHQELAQLKQQCRENLSRVEREWRRFQALKKQVVMQAMGSCRMRGGRKAALREVEQLQALEEKKEKEMSAVRLENVQLKQSLVHFETRMRAQDTTEGLLLIDFEQLKIENQTFNEKVEERNEELLKLRNKVDNNVRIITHVKEMLHFVDIENACRNSQLWEVDSQVALRRDILTKTKQARDSLRVDNVKLNQKCGLLGKEALLRDMEEKVGKTALLKERLEALKRHHAGLALSCKGMKRKIREAKAFLPS